MTRKAREIETLILTMYAAVPLYLTNAINPLPLVVFHVLLAGILLRVAAGKGPQVIPLPLMRALGMVYIPFYFVDAAAISGSAIAASTHLVLFIAVYQPIEAASRDNQAQRLLTTSLIFIASLATSTHLSVVLFVIGYAFLMFRQLMYISHMETIRSIGGTYGEPPSARAAGFYLVAAVIIAAALFPLLPRVRNPFVQGITGSLPGASSVLNDTIDFRERRVTPPDSTLVARIWMSDDARPFFTPIRLKGAVFDSYADGEWRQTALRPKERRAVSGDAVLARPLGAIRTATVQQYPQRGRLYLPSGTYRVSGLQSRIYEGPAADTYYTRQEGMLRFSVAMAYDVEPLDQREVTPVDYPLRPEIVALAQSIVGNEERPDRRAARIETWMIRNFRYVPNTVPMKETMSLEDFLLQKREGHCEYFAAGMTVLLTAVGVPARIAGGFYGGRRNPLTGYWAVSRDDAHAWTEVWDGSRWRTYDSTPPALRPGTNMTNAFSATLAALVDSITFIWDRYILTFGLADQVALLTDAITWLREGAASVRARLAMETRILGSPSFLTALVLLLGGALAAVILMRRHRPLFDALAEHFAAHGIIVSRSMTIEEALERLRDRNPEAAHTLEPLVQLYEAERFSSRPDRRRVAQIRQRLAELQT